MTEKEIQNKFVEAFSEYSDINIILEPNIKDYCDVKRVHDNILLCVDIIIEFGGKPFAIVELKGRGKTADCQKQLERYQSVFKDLYCYIAYIDDQYYIFNSKENFQLSPMSLTEVLIKLVSTIDDNAVIAKELKPILIEAIEKTIKSPKSTSESKAIENTLLYKKELISCIKVGNIMRHGSYLYLEQEDEIKFMNNVLWGIEKPTQFCRYTSAWGFYQSLKNKTFRIHSVYSMNDVLETKALDIFPLLKDERRTVSDRLYQGYIMCFSDMARKEKLLNWYMYGSKTKGVCFTINMKKDYWKNDNDNFFMFAPVLYIPKDMNDKRGKGMLLLSFLNDLLEMKIHDHDGNIYKFKIRLWHFWKYFFKYDFYEEEKEVRLVYIVKDNPIIEWEDNTKPPFQYISRGIDEMPFILHECIVGCNCGDPDLVKSILGSIANDRMNVNLSKIEGFRPFD